MPPKDQTELRNKLITAAVAGLTANPLFLQLQMTTPDASPIAGARPKAPNISARIAITAIDVADTVLAAMNEKPEKTDA